MKNLHFLAFILLAVGGLNWGLVGAFDLNVVSLALGEGLLSQVVYVLVGAAALFELFAHKKNCSWCAKKEGQGKDEE